MFSELQQTMRQCDSNFDLKINIGQHDLYFMVSGLVILLNIVKVI